MARTETTRRRNILFTLLAISGAVTLLFLAGEVIIRLTHKIPIPPYDNKEKDDVLGWKSKEAYHFQAEDFCDNQGGRYSVNINFGKHGFRAWDSSGNVEQPSVFFIGDSYVESLEASDKDLFYSIFRDSLPFRVFAAGTAGYGTTQELLRLRQFVDSINPQYVVLEMCSNDFPDNYWNLEKNTGYKVGLRRPYLMLDNKIEYHHPHYWIEDAKQRSYLLYVLFTKINNALIKLKILPQVPIGDKMIHDHGLDYKDYSNAYQLTDNCLKNIKDELSKRQIKLIVFMADDFEPGATNLKNICRKNGVDVIESVADEVRKQENSGHVVRAYDGYHWSPTGQRIVANEIIKYFRENVVNK